MSILIVQRKIPHYRIAFFNALTQRCSTPITVAADRSRSTVAPEDQVQFKWRHVATNKFGRLRLYYQSLTTLLPLSRKHDTVVLEANLRILSTVIIVIILYCTSTRVILWGHAGSRRRDIQETPNWRDRLFLLLCYLSDGFIAYTESEAASLRPAAVSTRIRHTRNTLPIEKLTSIYKDLNHYGRDAIRKELGLADTITLCYIGRLTPDKRPCDILEVASHLEKTGYNLSVIIVGDGPLYDRLDQRSTFLNSPVYMPGSVISWTESGRYLFASHIGVFPGYVGLCVNHCFAFGLPVVARAQRSCGPWHSPEIQYLEECDAGCIVNAHDIVSLASATYEAATSWRTLSHRAHQYAVDHLSLSQMVSLYINALEET